MAADRQTVEAMGQALKRLNFFKRTAHNAKEEGREDMGHFQIKEFWEPEDDAAIKGLELAIRSAQGETAMFPEAM